MEPGKSMGEQRTAANGDREDPFYIGVGDDRPYVYALGRVAPRFPNLGLRREFARVAERQLGRESFDLEAIREVLSRPENRYLARQMCWVLAREGVPIYLLRPRDPTDLDLLIESLHPEPGADELALVIGTQGEVAPPQVCNGVEVPVISFDQIDLVVREELLEATRADLGLLGDVGARYLLEVRGVLERILNLAGPEASLPEHRALNYLAVRHPEIYLQVADGLVRDFDLTDVEFRVSETDDGRQVVDVIFVYTNEEAGTQERYFARVDVTEEYPFLVTGLAPYDAASTPPPEAA